MNEEELRDLAVDWCITNGLVVRAPAQQKDTLASSKHVTHAPISLYPSRIPKDCYERAVKIQPLFNQLVDIVANDEGFVHEVMAE
jgi:glutathione synthase